MDFDAFNAYHLVALERDEVKYSLIISLMQRALEGTVIGAVRNWSFGRPGACALQTPPYPICLGNLGKEECERLADDVAGTGFIGAAGIDDRPRWFAERAAALGERFAEPEPMRILAISDVPAFPGAPGEPRMVTLNDADLFAEWFEGFRAEAVPHDPPATRQNTDSRAASGNFLFWLVDGDPVSMAGIFRRTRNTAAIAGVYTPPELRGRGYAGSVTAAVVGKIRSEGLRTACLYVDLGNPASNRCYAKIGFKPVCDSWVFRQEPAA